MVSESTLADLISLRDALIGCPLESNEDIRFVTNLDEIIHYIVERQQDGETKVLSSD
jgi:hypothetical protein